MNTDALLLIGGLVLVALVVFVVLREFWTWYWKQSEQVALLKSIDRSLRLLEARGRPVAPVAVAPVAAPRGPAAAAPVAVAVAEAPRSWWRRALDPVTESLG